MTPRTGVRQPLHQQHTDTLTPPGTVRTLRERLAPAVPRQTTLTTELNKRARRRHHRHATRKREITLPDLSDCTARCSATRDDEHAVSTVTAGPSSPSTYARRPDSTLAALPVPTYPPKSPSDIPNNAG